MKFRYKEPKDTETRGHFFPAGQWVEVTGDDNIRKLLNNAAFESTDEPVQIDADKNGYLKKEEIKAKLDSMGVKYPEKASRAELMGLL